MHLANMLVGRAPGRLMRSYAPWVVRLFWHDISRCVPPRSAETSSYLCLNHAMNFSIPASILVCEL